MFRLCRISSCALLLCLTAGAAFAQSQLARWTVDGVERRAILIPPSKPSGTKVPLVFAFHGAGDTAENFASIDLHHAWPQAMVVYMDGLSRGPNQGGAFQTNAAGADNRDLKFFDVVLADLRQRFPIDDARIYATGFSNGAKFVYLLWAARPKALAAVAPVAGMLAPSLTLAQPKPMIHIGGREDHQNEFQLQVASIELARRLNGATGAGKARGPACLEYASSKHAPVVTVLHDGGHVYPSNATELIVRFFQAH
jgi:polyhydroxybutyrate depolymerase